jgi:predicted MPP superfamily phosphohydrolase
LTSTTSFPQSFKFAFLSDTHIGVKNADEDLRRSVAGINADTSLKFVIISGDITELGTDEEIILAKSILSKLTKPLYIQTGNHDGNWSPSGGRIFNQTFGLGRFSFQYNGYLFIKCKDQKDYSTLTALINTEAKQSHSNAPFRCKTVQPKILMKTLHSGNSFITIVLINQRKKER